MSMPDLRIGSIRVPLQAGVSLTQTYEPLGGIHDRRMMNGSARRQLHWQKMASVISGQGIVPPGLADLDLSQTYLIQCLQPKAVYSESTIVNLPSNRRSGAGYTPVGRAFIGDRMVTTPVTLDGDEATLTAVPDAEYYTVEYWPTFTALMTRQPDSFDRSSARWSWSIRAEEV